MSMIIALAYAIGLYFIALMPKIPGGAALLAFDPRELTLRALAWRQCGGRV